MHERDLERGADGEPVFAALAAALDRAARDLALAEEPSTFIVVLEHESAPRTRRD